MAGIGVILNQNAGRSRSYRERIDEKLGFILGDPDSLRQTWAVEEIEPVARLFLERDIDILGISGGDGSNLHVLSTFIRTYGRRRLPRILFLCGGTHNANARSIGLKGSPEQILDRLVRRYHARERIDVVKRNILRIEDGIRVRHGFTAATGFLYRFFEHKHLGRHHRPWKVIRLLTSLFGAYFSGSSLIKDFFRLQPARISLAGEPLEWQDSNGIAASTMEQVGLGMRPFSRVAEAPGKFHAMAFRIRPERFVHVSWRMLRGRLETHPQHLNTVTDSLIVEAEQPIPYALDGDIFRGGNRLSITTGPRLELVLV